MDPFRPHGPRRPVLVLAALLAALSSLGRSAGAADLPGDLVHLRAVDPSIVQEMRYAGYHNFVGRPIAGYEAPECILARPVALALKAAQTKLAERGLSLKVYDCYRPRRAVAAFAAWAEMPGELLMRAEFYPDLDKARLFELGWLSHRSRHSRGIAVDLAIVPLPAPPQRPFVPGELLRRCDLPLGERFPDNSLDFGTGYDCFSDRSATADPSVSEAARANRAMLVELMAEVGLANYRREWWHFELPGGGGPRDGYDVPVRALEP